MRKLIYRICHIIGNILIVRIANKIYQPPAKEKSEKEKLIEIWINNNWDNTLRLNYNLNKDSLVIDLGGYQGQWASDIYSKYNCKIKIFEPCIDFAKNITERFKLNQNIEVFSFGLSDKNTTALLSIDENSSSIYKTGKDFQEIILMQASDFFSKKNICKIDLMKINIEGGEYDLLDHLIESGFIKNIDNLQIQFHDFVPDARQRMLKIQADLNKSHTLSYQYEFVWENWVLDK